MKRWIDVILNFVFGCACLFIFWLLAQIFIFAPLQILINSMSPAFCEVDWKPVIGTWILILHKSLTLEQTEIYRLL